MIKRIETIVQICTYDDCTLWPPFPQNAPMTSSQLHLPSLVQICQPFFKNHIRDSQLPILPHYPSKSSNHSNFARHSAQIQVTPCYFVHIQVSPIGFELFHIFLLRSTNLHRWLFHPISPGLFMHWAGDHSFLARSAPLSREEEKEREIEFWSLLGRSKDLLED